MGIILHKDGAYQEYSTITDMPLWDRALTLAQLTEVVRKRDGEAGLRELPARLARAHATGCSSMITTSLSSCISVNYAGPNESHLSDEEFIAQFLTLPG